jgi:CheY-like chemotaxis protein
MKRACILIVDDNRVNLKLAASVLDAAGYKILEAGDANEAINVIAKEWPDLILMDLAMPGLDGLSFTRQLKASAGTRDLAVVAFTASAMKGEADRASAAGCVGFISKPIDTRKFPQQIADILARQQSTPPATDAGSTPTSP